MNFVKNFLIQKKRVKELLSSVDLMSKLLIVILRMK